MHRIFALVGTFIAILAASSAQDQAKLQNGDTLNLVFRGIPSAEQTSLSGSYRIGDSGKLKLPYMAPFKIAGLTPSEGEREIEKRYKTGEIFVDPSVTIKPDGAPPGRMVTIMGEVQSQGKLLFDDKLTAIAAIGQAQGFSDFADKRSVKLVRGEKSYQLDLSNADSAHARTKLLPGDILVVRQRGRPFR